jgi:hypothetical protein
MHTIDTTAIVTTDHRLVVQSSVPEDILPGEHTVRVTIDPAAQARGVDLPFFRTSYPIGLTGSAGSFRREDIYKDADR